MPPDRSAPRPAPWPPASLPAEADAFDLWLRRSLRVRYAAVVAEPLPPALLDLAGQAAAAEDHFLQRVRERAYFVWLEDGRPEGRDLEHWMAAFTAEIAAAADPRRPPPGLSAPPRAGKARWGRD